MTPVEEVGPGAHDILYLHSTCRLPQPSPPNKRSLHAYLSTLCGSVYDIPPPTRESASHIIISIVASIPNISRIAGCGPSRLQSTTGAALPSSQVPWKPHLRQRRPCPLHRQPTAHIHAAAASLAGLRSARCPLNGRVTPAGSLPSQARPRSWRVRWRWPLLLVLK